MFVCTFSISKCQGTNHFLSFSHEYTGLPLKKEELWIYGHCTENKIENGESNNYRHIHTCAHLTRSCILDIACVCVYVEHIQVRRYRLFSLFLV